MLLDLHFLIFFICILHTTNLLSFRRCLSSYRRQFHFLPAHTFLLCLSHPFIRTLIVLALMIVAAIFANRISTTTTITSNSFDIIIQSFLCTSCLIQQALLILLEYCLTVLLQLLGIISFRYSSSRKIFTIVIVIIVLFRHTHIPPDC